jgi:hypothetical protein
LLLQSPPDRWSSRMYNVFVIIGVIVVALAVLAFFGLR